MFFIIKNQRRNGFVFRPKRISIMVSATEEMANGFHRIDAQMDRNTSEENMKNTAAVMLANKEVTLSYIRRKQKSFIFSISKFFNI